MRGNSVDGTGVAGSSTKGPGVTGKTKTGDRGVYGVTDNEAGSGVYGQAKGSGAAGVYGVNALGPGVWGRAGAGAAGVYGESEGTAATGVYGVVSTGVAGVQGDHRGGGYGVYGVSHDPGGRGVHGYSISGEAGVYGRTLNTSGSGVYGFADGGNAAGVYGRNQSGAGVWGFTPASASGVYGQSDGSAGRGVYGVANGGGGIAVRGDANGPGQTFGIYGRSTSNHGVGGISTAAGGCGVIAESPHIGMQGATGGTTNNDQGVRGIASNTTAWAGYFDGKVGARNGYSGATATFSIDHPLAPAERTLRHSYVAAPEMKNVYDGVVTTSSSGKATVALPAYFEALNRGFRYQLTVVGGFAQAIVSKEIAGGRFEISTDKPRVKVSWQVTGIRRDAYATKHGLAVEGAKTGADRGRYLHPEEHGQPAGMAVALHLPTGGAVVMHPEVPAAVQGPGAPRDDP